MYLISDINQLTANEQNTICYEGKKISKWWGRTLFYYNPQDNKLYYENFSIIGVVFHYLFDYKKEFNSEGLKEWLLSKKIDLNPLDKNEKVTRKTIVTALKIFYQEKLKQDDLKQKLVELCSAEQPNDEMIIQLFKEGLNIDGIMSNSQSIFDYIFSKKLHVVVEHLKKLKQDDLKQKLVELCSAEQPNDETIIQLFKEGLDINGVMPNNQSVLNYVFSKKRSKVAKYLIKQVPDINIQSRYGRTPLHRVLNDPSDKEWNTKELIQEILLRNPDVNIIDSSNMTPLYIACNMENLEFVQCLVEKGAIIQSGEKCALFAAINNGSLDILNYLLMQKFDKEIITPQLLLNKAMNAYVISYRISRKKNPTEAECGMKKTSFEIIKRLLEYGGDFHLACNQPKCNFLKILGKLPMDSETKAEWKSIGFIFTKTGIIKLSKSSD